MILVQAVCLLLSASWQHGLKIDLDKVPKKYAGLDGTEIAISESQERMAVVVDPKDVEKFLGLCKRRKPGGNSQLHVVTEEPRLVMNWRGKDHCKYYPVLSWIQTALIRKQMYM